MRRYLPPVPGYQRSSCRYQRPASTGEIKGRAGISDRCAGISDLLARKCRLITPTSSRFKIDRGRPLTVSFSTSMIHRN
jgi:hypothetical protein